MRSCVNMLVYSTCAEVVQWDREYRVSETKSDKAFRRNTAALDFRCTVWLGEHLLLNLSWTHTSLNVIQSVFCWSFFYRQLQEHTWHPASCVCYKHNTLRSITLQLLGLKRWLYWELPHRYTGSDTSYINTPEYIPYPQTRPQTRPQTAGASYLPFAAFTLMNIAEKDAAEPMSPMIFWKELTVKTPNLTKIYTHCSHIHYITQSWILLWTLFSTENIYSEKLKSITTLFYSLLIKLQSITTLFYSILTKLWSNTTLEFYLQFYYLLFYSDQTPIY